MRLSVSRAGPAVLVLAAAFAANTLPTLVRAEEGRVYTVQSDADLKKRADSMFKSLVETGVKVEYGSLEKGSGPNGLVIKNIVITNQSNKKLTIESLEVRDYDWSNPEMSKVADMSIKKLVVPADMLEMEDADLGLTQLTINADMKSVADDAKKTIEVSNLFIDIVELMELRFKVTLGGVAMADFKALQGADKGDKKDPEAAMKVLGAMTLVGASISLTDKSLVERAIRAWAKKEKITEQEAKAKLLEQVAEKRKEAQDDAEKEYLDGVTKFLTKPGTIELTANPAQPANLMMAVMSAAGSATAFKQMLGLTFTVK